MPSFPRVSFVALAALLVTPAFAQAGYSSAAMGRLRYLGARGELPRPDEVHVDELLNYHRHALPLPRAGQSVALDLRWESRQLDEDGRAVLQVGISTARIRDRGELPPLNLAIVVDRSGSMAAADKLDRVKRSLHALIAELRPEDRLAIVAYNHEVTVPMPSRELGDGAAARAAIDALVADGTTALHGGLMCGFEEVHAHWREGATNRVVLLTDGIANVGVTAPEDIARDARVWIDRGVDVSTIGVGRDLQVDLLRRLATDGRGLYHFVESADEIDKVFDREVESLLAPVARDVSLALRFGDGVTVDRVIGGDFERDDDGALRAKLPDLHLGLTQVVIVEARVDSGATECVAQLRFHSDAGNGPNVVRAVVAPPSATRRGAPERDTEVARNHAVATLAIALRDAAGHAAAGRDAAALATLHGALARAYESHPHMEDDAVNRVRRIVDEWVAVLEARCRTERREV